MTPPPASSAKPVSCWQRGWMRWMARRAWCSMPVAAPATACVCLPRAGRRRACWRWILPTKCCIKRAGRIARACRRTCTGCRWRRAVWTCIGRTLRCNGATWGARLPRRGACCVPAVGCWWRHWGRRRSPNCVRRLPPPILSRTRSPSPTPRPRWRKRALPTRTLPASGSPPAIPTCPPCCTPSGAPAPTSSEPRGGARCWGGKRGSAYSLPMKPCASQTACRWATTCI